MSAGRYGESFRCRCGVILENSMEIRRYRESDRPQLVALWQRVFPDDPPRNEPHRMIDAKLAVDDLIFVADEAGGIIGAAIAGYDGHRGWLYSVAVDAAMRRKRVGSALCRHAVADLRALGCIKVNLQVRSTNAAVVAFYESLGFEVEDRISMGLIPQTGSRRAD
ncbi:MAG: GNAT family acetyltransferase [Myxococcota bacterium]